MFKVGIFFKIIPNNHLRAGAGTGNGAGNGNGNAGGGKPPQPH